MTFLMDEEVVPVCSPAFLRDQRIAEAADLRRVPLLHLNTRPDAWELWFARQEVPVAALHGMLFDQFMTMLEAAVAGLGAALLPRFLIGREIHQGVLVQAVEGKAMQTGQYHLVFPPDRADYPPLAAFRDWIAGAFEADRLAQGRSLGQ